MGLKKTEILTLPEARFITLKWFHLIVLSDKKIESPIKSLSDLVKSDLIYGVEKDGQNQKFLESSKRPIHKQMVNHINEYDSAMSSSKQGVQRARGGGYAYITETPILEYYNNQKPCNTMLVRKLFEVKSYGFGLPKNSEHTNALSVAILKVRLSSFGKHTTRCKVFLILPSEKFIFQYCDLDDQQTEMSFFAWTSVTRQFPKTNNPFHHASPSDFVA